MKLEQQVCSLDLARRLKELGVKQDSQFYWRESYSISEHFEKGVSQGKKGEFGKYRIEWLPKPRYTTADIKWNERDLARINETEYSAFTVAELGEMLPYQIRYIINKNTQGERPMYFKSFKTVMDEKWAVSYSDPHHANEVPYWYQIAETEADARAQMLVYLLENKLI